MAEQLDAQGAKLVVPARAAMARADADSGAAVRDVYDRTCAAAPGTCYDAERELTANNHA